MDFINFMGLWIIVFITISGYGYLEIYLRFKREYRWWLLGGWVMVLGYYGGYRLFML